MDAEAPGPGRAAQFAELVDRVRHDRTFRARLRADPVRAVAQMGVTLRDSEWAGLRELLYA
jgi:hypothetical protein